MAKKKKSLREEYKELLPIDNQDYTDAKKYYEEYLEIFDGIIKCKSKASLKKLKDNIIKQSPWKQAIKKSKKSLYRGIADSDRSILLSLLETEIQIIKEKNLEDLEEIYENKVNRKDLANTFFENIFRDFEQAFDGNFENPRVIFMGINPKIVELDHDDYNLTNRYLNPFDSKRPVLMNKNLDEDYYFKNGGFFFSTLEVDDNSIMTKFMDRVIDKSKRTPFALWEFYPYATMSKNKWFNKIEIRNKKIKKYFEWQLVLPSQIWLLCLLSYAIKKAQLETKELILYCTKKNLDFVENTMIPLIDILELNKHENICILTNRGGSRVFSRGNIMKYPIPEVPSFIKIDSNKNFFASVWEIGKESENISRD